jgi:hypothetical protein
MRAEAANVQDPSYATTMERIQRLESLGPREDDDLPLIWGNEDRARKRLLERAQANAIMNSRQFLASQPKRRRRWWNFKAS